MHETRQITDTILMIRPISFRMNEQTAVNNYYQKINEDLPAEALLKNAQNEFDNYVDKLRNVGIDVLVINDTKDTDTPDAIFPNNWVSFHENGTVVLYPMFAKNRRLERREDLSLILEKQNYSIQKKINYTQYENKNIFLEGTGSLVLDRVNRKAYCAKSPRAEKQLFLTFCKDLGYDPIIFTANQTIDGKRKAIYHTNVMMCLGDQFAVICLDSIDDIKEKEEVIFKLNQTRKEIIEITEDQLNYFTGNMLQVQSKNGQCYIVMSQASYDSLSNSQMVSLEKYGIILASPLDTIETLGGGSARCMMAEIFLPKM